MLKIAYLFIVALLAGCAGSITEVQRIEAVPEVDKTYKRILVFAVTQKERVRAAVESELVAEMNKSEFEASRFQEPNAAVPWENPSELQKLVAEDAREGGYDGVLVVSLIRKNRESRYVPEQVVYQPIVTSIGPLASTTYMDTTVVPPSFEETTNYVLKSTLFDSVSGNPVWQLYSNTVNPDSLDAAARDFGKVVVKALRKTLPHAAEQK
ncbi:hypothetical protein QQF73_10940 [Marinobacter sp. M216]|uniref:DUF4136 domain-containing protein n=1 Tax=Marinobacter albus TaxID=3030833 RepID=A0ABT7HCQ6_9GAMM|nr:MULTISPECIES: hypothetical protein [unclassified Marinobacter]MBW7469594.1 hypothetical protein [Marinobacter sp. F4218]MDK9558137.1 hypothetical protein [Marinobacter sp. M216]